MSTYLSAVAHHASHLTRAVPAAGYPDLEQYLELLLGPGDEGSAFDCDESRRMAWRSHSSGLLLLVEPGSRPWAWWEYDAPEPVRPRESDAAYLARCGQLTASERISLAQAAAQPLSHATRNP